MSADRAAPGPGTWPPPGHASLREVDGIRWHVVTMGRGPTLLAVHGTGGSSHSFRALIPELAESFTIVAPDLPGHARTRAPRSFTPSLPGMAHALGRLVDDLDLEPTVVLGHSAGAAVLARLALDGGIAPSLLVGVAAALVPLRGMARRVFPASARMLSRSLAPQWIAAVAGRPGGVERVARSTGSRLDPRDAALYRQLAARPDHIAGVLSMMAHWDLEPVFAALPRLEAQVLLIAGAHDWAVPLAQQREVAARLRRARLAVIAQTGHLLHEERPAEVARVVRDAVANLDPPTVPSVDLC